jgi:uncharacterized protein YcfJ
MTKGKLSLLLIVLLAGCATVPKGPSVAIMPGAGKSFEQFQADETACRQYADQSVGKDVNTAGADNVVTGAAVGTVIGAAAGALLGGHHGGENGAGAGLLMGTAVGAGNAGGAERNVQHRYDIAFEQCMYAKGNQLPQVVSTTTYSGYRRRPVTVYQEPPQTVIIQSAPAPMPPPPGGMPPPPPGY